MNPELQKRLKQVVFPSSQFCDETTAKKSICLHHTAGGGTGEQVFKGWESTTEKVATCVVISRDGTIVQGFSSNKWGYSLGLKTANYREIEKQTIGIEIISYGWLKIIGGKFVNAYGGIVKPDEVCDLGKEWRGFRYFQKYTNEQIESTRLLLKHWGDTYGISLKYDPNIFFLHPEAQKGASGVFTHASYRADKTDVFPQPELIAMLKTL